MREVPGRRISAEVAERAATKLWWSCRLAVLQSARGCRRGSDADWLDYTTWRRTECRRREMLSGREETGETHETTRFKKRSWGEADLGQLNMRPEGRGHACHSIRSRVVEELALAGGPGARRDKCCLVFPPAPSASLSPSLPLGSIGGVSSNSRDWPGALSA